MSDDVSDTEYAKIAAECAEELARGVRIAATKIAQVLPAVVDPEKRIYADGFAAGVECAIDALAAAAAHARSAVVVVTSPVTPTEQGDGPAVSAEHAKWAKSAVTDWQHIGPCGDCGGPAFYCEGPHGSATWAIHCREVVRHNAFSTDFPAVS